MSAAGSAFLANGVNAPGGTAVYQVYTDNGCTTQVSPAQTSTKAVVNGSAPPSAALIFNRAGTFYWQAVYSGDASNNGDASPCVALTVGKAIPDLSIAQTPLPVNTGDAFTAHVALSINAINPTGTSTLRRYSDVDCTLLISGLSPYVATLSSGQIPDGPAIVFNYPDGMFQQAVYSGDANNAATTSDCVEAAIAQDLPLMLALSPGNTVPHGGSVSAQANWPGDESPAGSVSYRVYAAADCSGTVFSGPETKTIVANIVPASSPVAFTNAGSYSWKASYSGDAVYNPASACAVLTVSKAAPALSLAQTPAAIAIGGNFSVHLSLSGDVVNPTGSVTLARFTEGTCVTPFSGLSPYVASLVNGQIADAPSVAFTFGGPIYQRATYSGDANNAPAATGCIAVATAGPLTVSIVSASLTPAGYANTATFSTGQLTITVDDGRATWAGWSVTAISTDFAYGGSSPNGAGISAAGFSVTAANAPVLISGQPVGAGGPSAAPGAVGKLNQTRTIAAASSGFGSGAYRIAVPIKLVIPAQSQAGDYTATLTVSTTAAP